MNASETAREHPYEPEDGDAVMDTTKGRVGRSLGWVSGEGFRLRPVAGGEKWYAWPTSLRPAQPGEVQAAREMRGRRERS